jgi:hypothetical protein
MTTEHEVADLRRRLNVAHATAAYHKKQSAARYSEIRRLRAEQKDGHRIGYEAGAKATMLSTYLAIADYQMPGIEWLTARMRAAAKKLPPPNTAMDEAVTRSVLEHMRGYNPRRAEQIEKEFADFLAGDTP